MILKGKLLLKENTTEYGVYGGGNYYNLTDILTQLLLEETYIKIKLDNNIIFEHKGKLFLDKISGYLYNFVIEEDKKKYNLDNVLWNLVGSKIHIEIIHKDRLTEEESEVES